MSIFICLYTELRINMYCDVFGVFCIILWLCTPGSSVFWHSGGWQIPKNSSNCMAIDWIWGTHQFDLELLLGHVTMPRWWLSRTTQWAALGAAFECLHRMQWHVVFSFSFQDSRMYGPDGGQCRSCKIPNWVVFSRRVPCYNSGSLEEIYCCSSLYLDLRHD